MENKSHWYRYAIITVIVPIVCVSTFVVCSVPIYQDWAFICENTGSRKGYREWFIGIKSNRWYRASALEQFMGKHYPNELNYNWCSYMGTKKTVFGQPTCREHGSPGPLISFPTDIFTAYIERIDNSQKKALYNLFASGNESAIEAKLAEISSQMLNSE